MGHATRWSEIAAAVFAFCCGSASASLKASVEADSAQQPLSGKLFTCDVHVASPNRSGNQYNTICIESVSLGFGNTDLSTTCAGAPVKIAGPAARVVPEAWPECGDDAVRLYDVDFATPDQQIGEEPFLDQGAWPRRGPSGMDGHSFGGIIYPLVEERLGDLVDQPLVLEGGQAALFGLGAGLSLYRVDFAMLTDSDYRGGHAILLDVLLYDSSLLSNLVSFNRLGPIRAYEKREPVGDSFHLGFHEHREVVRARIDVDTAGHRWRVWFDEVLYHAGRYGGSDLEGLVIETNPWDTAAGIDDVRVIGCATGTVFTPTPLPPPTATATPAPACACDCNEDRSVSLSELMVAVRASLEVSAIPSCQSADRDDNGTISIDELIAGVDAAIGGCFP